MNNDAIIGELARFREKLGVPAVFGGVIDSHGGLTLEVVGNRRRGHAGPATLQDQVHIGSCLKMVTALLFGTYVSENKADWEMPISEAFPELKADIDAGWNERPVWELFCCVSGMVVNPPRSVLVSGYSDTRPVAAQRTEQVKIALSKPPHKPGRFVYSNISYIVMGAAIDRLSGTSFEEALEARIFKPLGVKSAGFEPPPDIWGHRSKLRIGGFGFWRGKPADPSSNKSDNPLVLSSAGTLHLRCEDWAKLLRLFLINNTLGIVDSGIIERILQLPAIPSAEMAMGWKPVEIEGIGFGAQGSNTLWAATALMDERRERAAFVVCNDGRSSVLLQSVHLAERLMAG